MIYIKIVGLIKYVNTYQGNMKMYRKTEIMQWWLVSLHYYAQINISNKNNCTVSLFKTT